MLRLAHFVAKPRGKRWCPWRLTVPVIPVTTILLLGVFVIRWRSTRRGRGSVLTGRNLALHGALVRRPEIRSFDKYDRRLEQRWNGVSTAMTMVASPGKVPVTGTSPGITPSRRD